MAPKPQKTVDAEAESEFDEQPTLEDGSPAMTQPTADEFAEQSTDVEPSTVESSPYAQADAPVAPTYATLRVNVKANLSLAGGPVLQVNQGEATVPDTEEVRSCIAAGYLDLVDGDTAAGD